ncbi:MAG TPA: PKD domain-containing protein [Bacteroidia bacterium]
MMVLIVASVLVNEVNAQCTVNARYSMIDSSGNYMFTNLSTGANKYLWNFGDGNYSTLKDPTHVYKSTQFVLIILTAYDTTQSNCSDTSMFMMTVNPPCNVSADFIANPVTKLTYFSSSAWWYSGRKYHSWDFGDGSTSTLTNPQHTYASIGNYSVRLIVYDSANTSCRDTAVRNVTIKNCYVKADFESIDSVGVWFFRNKSVAAQKYRWDFGDTTFSNATNPTHVYTYPSSNRWVTLYAYDSLYNNCYDSARFKLQNPTCRAVARYTLVRTGMKISVINYSLNSDWYAWDFGDGKGSYNMSDTHTYMTPGNYTVRLIAGDSKVVGCLDTTYESVLINNCYVLANYTVKDSAGVYTFTNTSTGANKYKWYFGTGDSSELKDPTHSFSGTGYYSVVLYAYDTTKSNCYDLISKMYYYYRCRSMFNIGPDSVTNYSAIIYNTSVVDSGTNYIWYFGDGDSSTSMNPTHVYSGQGPYTLCLYIYSNSCSSYYCDTVSFDSLGNFNGLGIPFSIKVVTPGSTVSVKDVVKNQHLKVWPNPTASEVNLYSEEKSIQMIQLSDVSGRMVINETTDTNSMKIDLSNISQGLYNLKVIYADGTSSNIKLIVNSK